LKKYLIDNGLIGNDSPIDPALWVDWMEAIGKARDDKNWDTPVLG